MTPDELRAALGIDDLPAGFDPAASAFFPATADTQDSPAGVRDGHHVALAYPGGEEHRVVTPLGEFRCRSWFDQVLRRPGGGVWFAQRGRLIDADTGAVLPAHNGVLDGLTHDMLHRLRPRDADASRRLRAMDAATAAGILDALAEPAEPGVGYPGGGGSTPPRTMPVRRATPHRPPPPPAWTACAPEPESGDARPCTPAWRAAERALGTGDPVLLAAVVRTAADVASIAHALRAHFGPPPAATG
ncbi:hypothetical protein [Corynebacterium sp. 335C]